MDPNNYNNNDPNHYYIQDNQPYFQEAVIYEQQVNYQNAPQYYQPYPQQYPQQWPMQNVAPIPQNKHNTELISKAQEYRNNQVQTEDNQNNLVVQRFAAGKVWKDKTLSEWPEGKNN